MTDCPSRNASFIDRIGAGLGKGLPKQERKGKEATMSYRRDRLSHVIREVVSDAITNRLSDPRINRFTSVTRVEMSIDLRIANIYVSIMGTDGDARTTMRGLQSARGLIQTRLAKQLDIRHCPAIKFHLDTGIKRAIETYREIEDLKISSEPDHRATGRMAGGADSDTARSENEKSS